MINPDNPYRTRGTVSLVLGLLSVIPFGAMTGVPAILLAIHALREEPRSRGRARAGAVLGGLGTAMTIALVVLFSIGTRPGRRSNPNPRVTDPTVGSMFAVRSSFESWARENGGAYPSAAEFDSDSSRFMKFLARDRVG
jgi:amino acid transporter